MGQVVVVTSGKGGLEKPPPLQILAQGLPYIKREK